MLSVGETDPAGGCGGSGGEEHVGDAPLAGPVVCTRVFHYSFAGVGGAVALHSQGRGSTPRDEVEGGEGGAGGRA